MIIKYYNKVVYTKLAPPARLYKYNDGWRYKVKMKHRIKSIVILIYLILVNGYGASYIKDLNTANNLYDQDKKDKAKNFFLKAAKNGSAEAHFKLAYQYIVEKKDAIYHYSEAAKLGHSKALKYALEELFFRGNDLVLANPQKALKIYKIAKSKNSEIKLYNEENTIKILKMASEVPLLDGKKLIEDYQLKGEFHNDGYYIWKLAEKASKGQKFKNPTPLLVLQLIIKGGFVPAELEGAVSDYYDIWKNKKKIVEFDICQYVTSGYGMSLCANRQKEKENQRVEKELSSLLIDIKINNKDLLYSAYRITAKYLEAKVWNEEGHDGSGYVQWATDSLLEQKNKYIKLLKNIANGYIPESKGSLSQNDALLNKRYKELRTKLKKSPVQGMRILIHEEGFKKVQRLWIPYRDKNVKLFIAISKNKNIDFWNNYFTIQRIKEYDSLSGIIEDYQ